MSEAAPECPTHPEIQAYRCDHLASHLLHPRTPSPDTILLCVLCASVLKSPFHEYLGFLIRPPQSIAEPSFSKLLTAQSQSVSAPSSAPPTTPELPTHAGNTATPPTATQQSNTP